MTLKEVIWQSLISDEPLKALVGDNIFEGIGKIPRKMTSPVDGLIAYGTEQTEDEEAIDGTVLYSTTRLSFYCMSTDSQKTGAIGAAAKAALKITRGLFDGINIMQSSSDNGRDEPLPEVDLEIHAVYWSFVWRLI